MPRHSVELAAQFARRVRSIDRGRFRLEKLVQAGHLESRIATQMYEGLYLSAHISFEHFIEELFVGLLVDGRGVQSQRNAVRPRITVGSHRVARDILVPGQRSYVDWLPYDNTVKTARKVFHGGRPFSELTKAELATLEKCQIIRNVIAHHSRFSVARFEKKVLANTPLPPVERTPAGYLRGLFRATPSQTRFEEVCAQLIRVAHRLAR